MQQRKVKAEKKGKRRGGREYGFGRFAGERLIGIHRLILERRYPNAKTLAREFEVSARTIKRDLQYIRDILKRPLEFDLKRNGFYFTGPVAGVPPLSLSEKEIVGLFVAQKAIAQYHGTSLQPVLENTFRKMTARLDDAVQFSMGNLDRVLSIRPYAPGDAELESFELLAEAVRQRKIVTFWYRKHGQLNLTRKRVHPYHIAYVNNRWTLFACDPKERGMRKFVLFRLTRPEVTHEKFTVATNFDLNKELAGSFGLYKGEREMEVVVDFDAWGADDVRGRNWHAS